MASSSSILLLGGIVFQHGPNDAVSAIAADVLVDGNTIKKVEKDIAAPSDATKVIDCRGKIISPDFIDTHRHTWQTQLKGRYADELLMEYMLTGTSMNSLYSPEDTELGQLGGALESIDAGTTTLVDHSSIARSPQHVESVVSGTEASGIRAVICPAVANYVTRWEPKMAMDKIMVHDWFLPTWDAMADRLFKSSGGMRPGLAFDTWNLPTETIQKLFGHVRSFRNPAHVVTSHCSSCNNSVKFYKQHGILGPDVLISHLNMADNETLGLVQEWKMHISATPSTELQMGLGDPAVLQDEWYPHASLGIDCHSATNASIVEEARLLLQWACAVRANKGISKGHWHTHGIKYTVEQAFNLATVKGARAIRLEHEICSIAPGKRADIAVWDGRTPAMAMATTHAPLAAIMLHSSTRDVDTVIVDCVVRKEKGNLLAVELNGQRKSWAQILQGLTSSYQRLQTEIDRIGVTKKGGEFMAAYGMA